MDDLFNKSKQIIQSLDHFHVFHWLEYMALDIRSYVCCISWVAAVVVLERWQNWCSLYLTLCLVFPSAGSRASARPAGVEESERRLNWRQRLGGQDGDWEGNCANCRHTACLAAILVFGILQHSFKAVQRILCDKSNLIMYLWI